MQFLYMQATCQSTPRAAQNPICCILCSRNILGLFSSCPPRARRRHERAPCCRPATHGAAFPAFIASKSLNPSYLPHVAIRQRFREPRQHANAGCRRDRGQDAPHSELPFIRTQSGRRWARTPSGVSASSCRARAAPEKSPMSRVLKKRQFCRRPVPGGAGP